MKDLLSGSIEETVNFILISYFLLISMIERFFDNTSGFSWDSHFFSIAQITESNSGWFAWFGINEGYVRDVNWLDFLMDGSFLFILGTTLNTFEFDVNAFNKHLICLSIDSNDSPCLTSVLTWNNYYFVSSYNSPSVEWNLLIPNDVSFLVGFRSRLWEGECDWTCHRHWVEKSIDANTPWGRSKTVARNNLTEKTKHYTKKDEECLSFYSRCNRNKFKRERYREGKKPKRERRRKERFCLKIKEECFQFFSC